jgi:hypothetical protein
LTSITTLVEDIYELFRKPHKADPRRTEELGQAIAQKVAERLLEERTGSYLRMSNLGKGDRRLWYDINAPQLSGEELEPYTKIKFLFGDILELLQIYLAEEAGHDVQNKQAKVDVDGVQGSIDCTIDGVLVDSKSASTISFKKFQKHQLPEDDPFGYMEQLAGYSEGLGGIDAGFLAIDKQLGHITFDPHPKEVLEGYRIRDRIKHIKEVLDDKEMPERCYPDEPYGKSGNMALGTNCSYCPFKKSCWKDSNGGIGLRTFMYARGPVHFTQVNKEPEVMEITF